MLKANVYGFVQGVGYRLFVNQFANKRGIKGYVKNLSNGSVEVVADGIRADLDDLLKHLNKGPFFAKVQRVDYSFSHKNGNFMSFEIIRESNYFMDQIKAYYRFFLNIISNARITK